MGRRPIPGQQGAPIWNWEIVKGHENETATRMLNGSKDEKSRKSRVISSGALIHN
jgi:hypothetical protein